MVAAPLVRARRHGATPSISVSSEKLRNVLIWVSQRYQRSGGSG